MGSQGRAEMRKRNFTSLVVKAVWKRNGSRHRAEVWNGTSDLQHSRQNGSAGADVQIFGSAVKLKVRKQIFISLTGPYPADCHCQC